MNFFRSYFFKNEPLICCPFLSSKLDSPIIKTLHRHSLNVKKICSPMFWFQENLILMKEMFNWVWIFFPIVIYIRTIVPTVGQNNYGNKVLTSNHFILHWDNLKTKTSILSYNNLLEQQCTAVWEGNKYNVNQKHTCISGVG